jgi:hypothetical protein
MNFQDAVGTIEALKNAWCAGLQALRAEDKTHIEAEDPRKLTGSVDVDTAYQKLMPQSNRWDFGIAFQHSNREKEVVYWVELHTASDSQVKVVIKKAQWLLDWLKGQGSPLAGFEKEIIWVSSGATTFTRSSPQRKLMAQAGLQHVGCKLRIPTKRKV